MKRLKIACMMAAGVMAAFMLSSCGTPLDEGDAAGGSSMSNPAGVSHSGAETPQLDCEFPEECKLTDGELAQVMETYADYMTESLNGSGITVSVRFADDGSVHFDGKKDENELPDLKVYTDLKSAFAYMYAVGQVDLEGNLLVVATEVTDEMEQAEQAAESDISLGASNSLENASASENANEG